MSALGFLDPAALRQLCEDRARASAQEEFLKAEGIPYKRQGKSILVCWVHVHAWIEGRPIVAVSSWKLDVSKVN